MNFEKSTRLHLLEPTPKIQYYQVAHYSVGGTQLARLGLVVTPMSNTLLAFDTK